MPTVRKRPDSPKLKWVVDYREFGRRRRAGFETKVEADAFKKEIHKKLARQVAGLPDRPVPKSRHVTFAEYAEQFLEGPAQDLAATTQVLYRERIELHLEPVLGKLPLASIDRAAIERYKQRRQKDSPAPATINRDLALLKQLLRRALDDEMIVGVPKIRMLKEVSRRPRRALATREVTKLLRACDDLLPPLVFTAVTTGIRRGALVGLRWSHVDLPRKLVTVHAGKGGKSRTVPLSPAVLTVLRQVKKRTGGTSRVFGWQDFPKKRWYAAVKASKLDVQFHELRHTYTTDALRSGLDVAAVRDLVGHASIVTTEKYVHTAAAKAAQGLNRRGLIWSQTILAAKKAKKQPLFNPDFARVSHWPARGKRRWRDVVGWKVVLGGVQTDPFRDRKRLANNFRITERKVPKR